VQPSIDLILDVDPLYSPSVVLVPLRSDNADAKRISRITKRIV
jgi:hypothetical protein